jgi:hypothetical protein
MSAASRLSEVFHRSLVPPTRGVAGLVDDLLSVWQEHALQLDWQPDRCRVRVAGGDWDEVPDVGLRRSVFRAVLARVAVLCNERSPNSVSPYGGQGELSLGTSPPAVFRVTFANTPAEQKLELTTETRLPTHGEVARWNSRS